MSRPKRYVVITKHPVCTYSGGPERLDPPEHGYVFDVVVSTSPQAAREKARHLLFRYDLHGEPLRVFRVTRAKARLWVIS